MSNIASTASLYANSRLAQEEEKEQQQQQPLHHTQITNPAKHTSSSSQQHNISNSIDVEFPNFSVRQELFGTEYEIGIKVLRERRMLVVHLEDLYTLDRWQVDFPADDIQHLTEQAGSAKSFAAFVRMLYLGLGAGSESDVSNTEQHTKSNNPVSSSFPSVQCELLEPSYASQLLRRRRHRSSSTKKVADFSTCTDFVDGGDSGHGGGFGGGSTSASDINADDSSQNDVAAQVLLVRYRNEFENVAYPLPLYYMGPPDVRRVQHVLRSMHRRARKALYTHIKIDDYKALQQQLADVLREKEDNERELTNRIAQLEQSFQRKMQATVVKLKSAVERLESILIGERRAHEQQSAQLKMENFDLRTRLEFSSQREASLKKQLEVYQQSRLHDFPRNSTTQRTTTTAHNVQPRSRVRRTTSAASLKEAADVRRHGQYGNNNNMQYSDNQNFYDGRFAHSYDAGLDRLHHHHQVRAAKKNGSSFRTLDRHNNSHSSSRLYRHSSDPPLRSNNVRRCRQSVSPATVRYTRLTGTDLPQQQKANPLACRRREPRLDAYYQRENRENYEMNSRNAAGDGSYNNKVAADDEERIMYRNRGSRRSSATSSQAHDINSEQNSSRNISLRRAHATLTTHRQENSNRYENKLSKSNNDARRLSQQRYTETFQRERSRRRVSVSPATRPAIQQQPAARFNPTEYIQKLQDKRGAVEQARHAARSLTARRPRKTIAAHKKTTQSAQRMGKHAAAGSNVVEKCGVGNVITFVNRAIAPFAPSTASSQISSKKQIRRKKHSNCLRDVSEQDDANSRKPPAVQVNQLKKYQNNPKNLIDLCSAMRSNKSFDSGVENNNLIIATSIRQQSAETGNSAGNCGQLSTACIVFRNELTSSERHVLHRPYSLTVDNDSDDSLSSAAKRYGTLGPSHNKHDLSKAKKLSNVESRTNNCSGTASPISIAKYSSSVDLATFDDSNSNEVRNICNGRRNCSASPLTPNPSSPIMINANLSTARQQNASKDVVSSNNKLLLSSETAAVTTKDLAVAKENERVHAKKQIYELELYLSSVKLDNPSS